MNHRSTILTVTLCIVCLIAFLALPAQAGKKILLKVQSFVHPDLVVVGTNIDGLAKQVNAIGAGLTIKVYAPGKLIPPKEILQAVSAGHLTPVLPHQVLLLDYWAPRPIFLVRYPLDPMHQSTWLGFIMVMVAVFGRRCTTKPV